MTKDILREKIIEKATEIFNKYGYKKTAVDEIAHQLGKGKSSIYYYFSGKEEIFQAVVEKEADKLRGLVRESINKSNDPIEKIKNYVLTRVIVYKEGTSFYNALKNDDLLHLDFIENLRKKYETTEIEVLKNILNEGVKSGKFKIDDTHLAAVAIVTALKGLEETFSLNNDVKQLETKLDHLLNVLFYGIIIR